MTFNNAIGWLRKDGPRFENLSIIRNSATSISIRGANGSALSARNAGYITLPSKATPGALNVYRITADQTVTQSDMGTTNNMELATGVAHATDLPLFVYAVVNDSENAIAFMLSRYPNTSVSPVAGKISQAGASLATTQGSFFSMTAITAADYESNPCLCIGSFRATQDASNNWSFTAFDFSDGIGMFQENRGFILSISQYGAASGKYFYANGGTAPSFDTNDNAYWVTRGSFIKLYTNFLNCTVSGVGAVNLQLALPFRTAGATIGTTTLRNAAGDLFVCGTELEPPGTDNKIRLTAVNDASDLIILNQSVTTDVNFYINYQLDAPIRFS